MLDHYRVLDLTDERGHLAGFILAQMGAEVIAIEPPSGSTARRIGPFANDIDDGEHSLTFWSYNRGKKSVSQLSTTKHSTARIASTAQIARTRLKPSSGREVSGTDPPTETPHVTAHTLRGTKPGIVFNTAPGTDFNIGMNTTDRTDEFYHGDIAEIRAWDRALAILNDRTRGMDAASTSRA